MGADAALKTREFEASQFGPEIDEARRAAEAGPVFITEDGRKTAVLLSLEEYKRVSGKGLTIGDLLGDAAAAEIEFELPKREIQEFRNLDWD